MALIACHECNREVSTESKSCPSCGAKVRLPKKKSSVGKLFAILAVLYVVGASINGMRRAEDSRADETMLASVTPTQRSQILVERQAQAAKALADIASKALAKKAADARGQDIGMAEITCQMAAERSANDPSSIDWIRSERDFSYSNSAATEAVSVQPMRAKNGFGGVVRTGVKCKLAKSGDAWRVVSMEESR